MSRHAPSDDDFSFLPTVNDTEALSPEELWARAKAASGQDEEAYEEQPPASDETWAEEPSEDEPQQHPEEYWDEPAATEPQAEIWDSTEAEEAYPEPELAAEDEVQTEWVSEEVPAEPEELVAQWETFEDEAELPAAPPPRPRQPEPPTETLAAAAAAEVINRPCTKLAKRRPAPEPEPEVELPDEPLHSEVASIEPDETEAHDQADDQVPEHDSANLKHAAIAEPAVIVGDAGPFIDPEAPADVSAELEKAKRRAFMVSLSTVAGMMFLTMLVHVVVPEMPAAEITAFSSAEAITETESMKKVASAAPQTTPMAASIMPIAAAGVSDIAIPQVDITTANADLNIGSSMGSFSGGISSGTAGGTVSFMGNRGTGKRIVFAVDVSSSMSARGTGEGALTRFELLKRELTRSLSGMPAGAQYQVIFFSDFAWSHEAVDSSKADEIAKAFWEISSETVASARIPPARYITANVNTLRRSKDIIARADNPGGTNWGSGLIMALNMSPAPDVIFFMTDGNRNDEGGWIKAVSEFNARRGGRTIIHTTALMEPDAADELNQMATSNRGKFTVVLGNGKIIKGDDWFKGVRE